LLQRTTIGFADRAVEGGIPKESAKPYFPPRYVHSEEKLLFRKGVANEDGFGSR
jgi:hypothetical protein